MTTRDKIQVGSRVCRKAIRDRKIVGTVERVDATYARVQWDTGLVGGNRIGGGKWPACRIRLNALILESAWQPRKIDKPADGDYQPVLVRVDVQDDSGVCEYGRNAWTFNGDASEKALEMAHQLIADGKRVKVQRREEAKVVPSGCRAPRTFSRWVTLLQSRESFCGDGSNVEGHGSPVVGGKSVTTTPKTIVSLVAEGQCLLAEQERREREIEEKLAADARAAWLALREQSQEDLGELALKIPENPPDDFAHFQDSHKFELRPFGAASLFVRFERDRDGKWHMFGEFGEYDSGIKHKPISVQTAFEPCFNDDAASASGCVRPTQWHETDNLAEALAICHRATEAYRACVQECQRREPFKHLSKPEPNLTLTDAERGLVLALRELIEERTANQ